MANIMTQNQKKEKSTISWIKKSSFILACLFLLYVIAGFWVVPPLLKPRLENELSSQIGRKVTIEEIKLNPLTLSATTKNLTVYEIDGEPFAGFEELFVNTQLSSILKWAVTFKEIRILAPFGVLKILPEKKLNIDDILSKVSQPKHTPIQKAELPRAVISKLQVIEGNFSVYDLTGTESIHDTFFPITFTLENLSTLKERQAAYKFVGVGASGEKYQLDGQLSVNPVRVEGSYSTKGTNLKQLWKHLKDQVSFQIINGTIGASGNYTLEFIDGTLNAKLKNGEFELKDFQVTEKGKDKAFISLPFFSLQGVSADLKTQEIIIEQVKTTDAKMESWLEPDGSFKPLSLFLTDLKKLQEIKKAGPTEPRTTASQPWYLVINKIEVANWDTAIEDRTLPKTARFTFDNIKVSIDNLTNKKNLKANVDIALQLNQTGTVKVNGSAGIDPMMADLRVISDNIALQSFQPYVAAAVNAQIATGTSSSKGHILYKGIKGQPQIRFQGELSIDGLEIKDRLQPKDFIKLSQFKTSDIILELLPNRLHVANVLINKLHARVTIDQNGTVNVVQAFTPVQKKDQKGKENLLQRLVNFLILQFKGPVQMNVELVQLLNFKGDFVDNSITPAYTTNLEISKGTLKGVSSDPSARADLKIKGNIDQSAIIESTGKMNPLNALQHTEVDFSLKDFDLKPISPYSANYVGYNIAQGKLHLKLNYRVADDTVKGDNRIYIDQLTLGNKVDSPDALKLPLALGVALLKDKNGRITLKVPVGGNIKDPQFDIGQAIINGLTGTVDDVSKSPFSTITEIDGFKGEELRFIEFEFGLSELNAQSIKKLNALAKFLNERTALTLGIEGTADRQMDWTEMSGRQSKKGQPGNKQKTSKVQHENLANGQDIDDKQLKQLSQMRAEQVKAYLTQQGKVAAERVQSKPVQIKSSPNGDYGRVELFLSAQ
ncbi:MAG: DUF748 domain-containing protein [Deltaproteobacteria bacterium]|nr:DUF748 domain-containing protein [Deltaproteobacteria bacterium]MBW1970084.1 DUF748 domain-containing protein [Deltaproteobacteria bacterium]MBW2157562.1 DUF748 domain-containing protein [Deltaproteobacteria bacterium]